MAKNKQDLHQAIIENNKEKAKKYILEEADVDAWNNDGWSPLHVCAQTNNRTIAQWLVNAGAKINGKNSKGVTPLHTSGWTNAIAIAKLLIQHGANVNIKDSLQWNPLMVAAWNNHDELVDVYVQNGASINARNSDGSTALHLASYNNCLLVVSRLLVHKANINVQNNDGMTALDIAKSRNNDDCMQLLLQEKSLTKAPENAPITPVKINIHYCVGVTDSYTDTIALVDSVTQSTPNTTQSTVLHDKDAEHQSQPTKPYSASTKPSVHYRDIFFSLDKPEQDMPFLTELTKEQAKLSSDGSQVQPILPEQLINITLSGEKVRRKSEVVIANLLYSLDLHYVYERKMYGTVSVGINYPAFTIFCADDSIIVWEHVSELETIEKKQQFALLKRWYKKNGFLEGKNFFVSQDNDKGGVDSQAIWEIAEKINTLVESNTTDAAGDE